MGQFSIKNTVPLFLAGNKALYDRILKKLAADAEEMSSKPVVYISAS